jgi:hypothetical protein
MQRPKIEDSFSYALSSNAAWAGYKAHQNPNFFPKMSQGQSPSIRESSSIQPSTNCSALYLGTFTYEWRKLMIDFFD